MTRLYVCDVGSLAAWMYFANPEPDEMLIAMRNWISNFRESMKPTHMVMCCDTGRERRKSIDPSYKSGRDKKPREEELIRQLKELPALFDADGIPHLLIPGEEADDLQASVVSQFGSDEVECWVVSSDGDLAALVSDNVKLYDPRPDEDGNFRSWDVDGVTKMMGVPPWRVCDLLAIAGDSADSIPGIKGVGEDSAVKALRQTKSIGELFRKAAKNELVGIKPLFQKRIAEGRDQYEHCLKLTTLYKSLNVGTSLEQFKLGAMK